MRVPDSMPVAVYQGANAISVETRPVPEPGPGEVLVEVSHCGICGSDLHFAIEGWGKPGVIGGHEYAGRIAALGAGIEDWAEGDDVVGDLGHEVAFSSDKARSRLGWTQRPFEETVVDTANSLIRHGAVAQKAA